MFRTDKGSRLFRGSAAPRWAAAALAFLAWAGLSLHLEFRDKGQILLNLIASFHLFDLAHLVLLPALFLLFRKSLQVRTVGRRWAHLLPACFFAANLVAGHAFYTTGSWSSLRGLANGQLIKALYVWLSWTLVLNALLRLLFSLLDKASVTSDCSPGTESASGGRFHPLRAYQKALRIHPFRTAFLTLLILYLPHFFIAYPAMFMGDTSSMIVQGYSELGDTGVGYLSPYMLLRPDVYINQHHPVPYTLLLHLFLRIGDAVFHSLNEGIFLLCCCQSVAMLAAFAYGVSTLARRDVKPALLMAILVYLVLHPQVRNFLFLATKDGLYTVCFILMISAFFRLRGKDPHTADRVMLCLGAAGLILFRNEGKYVLLLSGLLMALADRKNRKTLLLLSGAAAVFSLILFRGIYPALGYTRGGTQEALSIPLQQTARIVRDHPEDISVEERDIIDGVLEYDRLGEAYNPDVADQVKNLYRPTASRAALMDYLRIWARLALRYPGTAIQATYGNYYQYLYPGEFRMLYDTYHWSALMCQITNERIAPLGKSFSLPEWNKKFRFISDSIVESGLFNLPPFSLLMTPALYSWALLSLLCWVLGRKKKKGSGENLAVMIPLLITFLVFFAGPTNAFYSRYMLPLTSFLPFLSVMLLTAG